MDHRTSCQDVMRCALCKTAVVQTYCETCHVNLCKPCVGEHISTHPPKPHKIVDSMEVQTTFIYPKCTSHDEEICEIHCNHCDIPVCSSCLVTDKHLGHKFVKILQFREEKLNQIIKDKIEPNEKIYPIHEAIASDVQNRMSQLEKEYGDLSTAITKHGEDWHREIDNLVEKLKAEVDEMKTRQLETLKRHLNEIHQKMSNIKGIIRSINDAVDSSDISTLLSVPSVDQCRKLPSKIIVSKPKFSAKKLLVDQFCSLTLVPLKSDDEGYLTETTERSPKTESPHLLNKEFLDEPQTVTTIDTGYRYLYNVACLSDEEIWTSGCDTTMKLYSINQGSLLKSITTKSGNVPYDIAVTKSGDLVYTDYDDRTMNIVRNEKIEEVIRLQDWRPYRLCNTSSDDLLVTMESDDNKQSKVVRYSGSTEKQTIQFDDKGKPLYSSGSPYFRCIKYITENRNLDICLSDDGARAVVVVNQAGILRFRYTGHTPVPNNLPFSPRGIDTDSQSHILTVDCNNHCVHIIDQDGQFLHYIQCGMSYPWGLSIDTNDNLFVAQWQNNQVKKITHY